MDLVLYAIDSDTIQLTVQPLADHAFVFDQLVVLPLVLAMHLHLLLAKVLLLASPVAHP